MSKSPILSARAQANQWLTHILGQQAMLDEALAQRPATGTDADQRFAMLLLLTTLQHLGQIDAVLARYLDKPLPAKRLAIMNTLRIGAAQLLLLHTPPHAVVNEAVAFIKKGKDVGLSGLVNAVLQKIAREKPALPEPIHNLPAWLRARWEKSYGHEAVATMAQLATQRPPLDIHTTADAIEGVRLDAQILRVGTAHAAVESLAGYAQGAFFVQDIAASYPVRLLGDVREQQVLDMCAAPGGKTMQLVQAGAFVTALDRSAARMKRFKENMARMGMQANMIVADAEQWQPTRSYDAILLDAPCSATGTWRRHPEMVHLVTPEKIAEMVAVQRALLQRAWGWLKAGGTLVYCVCSLEVEEGEAQADWFAQTHRDAQWLPIPEASGIPAACVRGDSLRTVPSHMAEQGGMDGFFAARFRKAA